MGLNRQDKAAVIEEMRGIVANTSAIVIAEYRGLTVEAVTKLRANARQQGVQLRVVKNTLVRRAVEGPAFADPFFWGQGVQIIVPEEKSVGSSVGFSCIIRPGVVLNRRATSARFSPA